MRALLPVFAGTFAAVVCGLAGPGSGARSQDRSLRASRSVGNTHTGSLVSGYPLPLRGPGFHFATHRGNPSAHFGTSALVRALMRATASVAASFPGSDLAIEDLSFERGGPIEGHGSHRSGRDADVTYYARHADGRPMNPSRSIWFDSNLRERGVGRSRAARFDPIRTHHLLNVLMHDSSIRVQYIFMAPHLQRALVAEARRADRRRLRRVLRRPRASRSMRRAGIRMDPHADHFHLRIYCPPADIAHGCVN